MVVLIVFGGCCDRRLQNIAASHSLKTCVKSEDESLNSTLLPL